MKLLKFNFPTLVMCLLVAMLTSCTSYKNVPYLQNSEDLKNMPQTAELYDARVQPKDLLTITVMTPKNPAASADYNLIVADIFENRNTLSTQPTLQGYLVDNEGNIDFPILGTLHVGGLTQSEIENMILEKIRPNFTDLPIVTVRFADFKISVLGEVTSPGTYTIKNEKVNVFEALALAKDMTIYGCRDNVKLIREDATGKKNIYELNLNDVSVITSPYYYLQQNDVLYVTPNKAKAKNSDIGSSTTLWFSATSIMISLTSLLYNILR